MLFSFSDLITAVNEAGTNWNAFQHTVYNFAQAWKKFMASIPIEYGDNWEIISYRAVATGRQYHIYINGRPRVRKKWEKVFKRRLRKEMSRYFQWRD